MRKLIKVLADALQSQGLDQAKAIEVAQNGMSVCVEALTEAANRQGASINGWAAFAAVSHELMLGDGSREQWEAAERALEAGDPGPIYGLLYGIETETRRRMAAGEERTQ